MPPLPHKPTSAFPLSSGSKSAQLHNVHNCTTAQLRMHLRRSCGHTLLVPAMAIVHSTVIFWQANYPTSECVPAAGFSGGFLRLLRWVSDGRRWVLKTWNLWQLCADFTGGNGKPASGLRPQVIVGFVGAENMILPWRYVQLCVCPQNNKY